MKIDYKILWVDDRIEDRAFQRILTSTKIYLVKHGFDCEIFQAKDFREFVDNFNLRNEYDIIITDYTLNNGTFGNQVIDYIRDNQHNYTEVFFYSAQTNINDIKLFSNSRITFFQLTEGDYKELEHEVIEVINQTIKKFQHIVAMRGMIMNETSSLDIDMMNLLATIIKKKGEDNVIPIIKKKFKETNNQFNNDIEEIKDITLILQKIGSEHRWRAIVRNMEKGEVKTEFEKYKTEIIDERNRFAHAVLEEDKNGRKYFTNKKDAIDFNEDKCKEIRLNIIKHKLNIENLKSILK